MKQHNTLTIFFITSLVFLTACGRSPAPVNEPSNTPFLGMADLGGSVSSQALVSGLTITLEDKQISDEDGIRTHISRYIISGADVGALSLYPVATPRTLAETNISNIRTISGERIDDVNVAQSIVLTNAATSANTADVQALLTDAQVLGTVVSTEPVAEGFRVVLEKRYPFDPADPNAIDSFLKLFAFFAEEATTQPTTNTLTFSMASVNIVAGETDIEVVIAPNLPAPTITFAD